MDEAHPNAADLDLFGNGSVFELLCTARTRGGEDTLAAWLKTPALADEVRDRQAAVAELRPRLDLREDLSILGASAQSGVDLNALGDWGAAPLILISPGLRLATLLFAGVNLLAVTAWLGFDVRLAFAMLAVLPSAAFALWLHDRVARALGAVEKRAHDLSLFAGAGPTGARAIYGSQTGALRAGLDTEGKPPSERIFGLVHLLDWLNAYRNPYFAFTFGALLIWRTQLAFALESWRAGRSGHCRLAGRGRRIRGALLAGGVCL